MDTAQNKPTLSNSIEQLTGCSMDDILRMSISEYRTFVEKKVGHPLRFVSRFPCVGRGNVMRDRLINHQEIEKSLDAILK